MSYEEQWYWCSIRDDADAPPEPDWSRVPEDRRDLVRERWREKSRPEPRRWKLWGPQIALYQRTPGMSVEVVGPVGAAHQVIREAGSDLRALGVERVGILPDGAVLVGFAAGRKSYDALLAVTDILEGRLGRQVEVVTVEGLSRVAAPKILANAEWIMGDDDDA